MANERLHAAIPWLAEYAVLLPALAGCCWETLKQFMDCVLYEALQLVCLGQGLESVSTKSVIVS